MQIFQISTTVETIAKVELTINENLEYILPEGETEIDVKNPTPAQADLLYDLRLSFSISLGIPIDQIKITSIERWVLNLRTLNPKIYLILPRIH